MQPLIQHKEFDIKLYHRYDKSALKEYMHLLLQDFLKPSGFAADDALYRGGFGRSEDFERLISTGSDYESAHANCTIDGKIQKCAATYATDLGRIGSEPWCRGLDPLYWALKGHTKVAGGYNEVCALVAYNPDAMIRLTFEIAAFKSIQPSAAAVLGILLLDFPQD